VRRTTHTELEINVAMSELQATIRHGPRAFVGRSWQRSSACGLRRGAEVELPFDEDFDEDSRLVRAAQPILDRLAESMCDVNQSVVLADQTGRIILRRVGAHSLLTRLDRASIAPGFEFAEEHAGTNGVGTALEESRIVQIHGKEHYAEFLQNFSCIGVPIKHPTRGTLEGVLDFTCLSKDFNPLMPSLLVEAAKHLETQFAQQTSASEVALLEAFMRISHTHRGPVVALRPNLFLNNAAATSHLTPEDQAVLWNTATSLVASGREHGEVTLQRGVYKMHLTDVRVSWQSEPGVVIRLAPLASNPKPARGGHQSLQETTSTHQLALPGRSKQWQRVLRRTHEIAREWQFPVAITGEPGTGKFRLVRRFLEEAGATVSLRHLDAADGAADIVHRCQEALGAGDAVVLRHMDLLQRPVLQGLTELVRNQPRSRLLVTCTADSPLAAPTLAAFSHQLWVPPLRLRNEDIADLVPSLLTELVPDRLITCAPSTVKVLMQSPWPGNTSELRDVLATSLVAAGSRPIEPTHLPSWVLKQASLRPLSPFEQAERDLIIETLSSVDNNRTEAARILGIGRATLYRKLRSLDIYSSW